MLTRQRAEEIFRTVQKWSTADETEAMISSTDYSLTRFANNNIHQNMAEEGTSLSVRAVVDHRTALAGPKRPLTNGRNSNPRSWRTVRLARRWRARSLGKWLTESIPSSLSLRRCSTS